MAKKKATTTERDDDPEELDDIFETGTPIGDAPAVEFTPATVRYVLNEGPNAGQIRPAAILDQGERTERLEVHTQPDDGLPVPFIVSLIQVIGGAPAPQHNADKLPGTWHWPAAETGA